MVPTDGVGTDVQPQHSDDVLGGDAGLLPLDGLSLHECVHVPVRLDVVLLLILAHLVQQLCTAGGETVDIPHPAACSDRSPQGTAELYSRGAR